MANRLCVCVVLVVALVGCASAKLQAGAGCHNAKDHCDAPKSGMGCCVANSKCYEAKDCAAFVKTCPFTTDTKKGEPLAPCLPDKSDFKAGACSPDAKAKAKGADGKDIPLNAEVKCFASEKLTCQVFRNATGHATVLAQCKAAAAKKGSAAMAGWRGLALLGLLLVAGFAAVMGSPV